MIQKILHITLATLILLSSSGLIINKHYCLDQLVSVAVMQEAEKCHIPQDDGASGKDDQQERLQRADCCKDVSSFYKVSQEQKAETTTFSLFSLSDIDCTVLPQQALALSLVEACFPPFQQYKPPLLVWDLPVRFQRFLC